MHHATDDLVVSPVVPLQGTAAGVVEGAHVHHEVGLLFTFFAISQTTGQDIDLDLPAVHLQIGVLVVWIFLHAMVVLDLIAVFRLVLRLRRVGLVDNVVVRRWHGRGQTIASSWASATAPFHRRRGRRRPHRWASQRRRHRRRRWDRGHRGGAGALPVVRLASIHEAPPDFHQAEIRLFQAIASFPKEFRWIWTIRQVDRLGSIAKPSMHTHHDHLQFISFHPHQIGFSILIHVVPLADDRGKRPQIHLALASIHGRVALVPVG
mmetsp:Transcript_21644/g.47412  ORF Transcript_21644/g.47412 Transcript_21644/m.47412 type:complete len:264 (-) Transcript_21644:10-801(-)